MEGRMTDCIWRRIGTCIDKCECDSYISANSDQGKKLMDDYIDEWCKFRIEFSKENGFNGCMIGVDLAPGKDITLIGGEINE